MICNATYLVDTLYVRGLTNQPYQLMEQGPKHDFFTKVDLVYLIVDLCLLKKKSSCFYCHKITRTTLSLKKAAITNCRFGAKIDSRLLNRNNKKICLNMFSIKSLKKN